MALLDPCTVVAHSVWEGSDPESLSLKLFSSKSLRSCIDFPFLCLLEIKSAFGNNRPKTRSKMTLWSHNSGSQKNFSRPKKLLLQLNLKQDVKNFEKVVSEMLCQAENIRSYFWRTTESATIIFKEGRVFSKVFVLSLFQWPYGSEFWSWFSVNLGHYGYLTFSSVSVNYFINLVFSTDKGN